jgi:hypothetical protein
MPDIVSGPSLASARTWPGTLAGPVGTRRNRTRQGGGSEGPPHCDRPLAGKAAPAATPRSPARPRRPSRGLAAHRTCLVHCHAQAWVMGEPGCPDATMPVPGLCRPGRRRPSPVRSSCPPGVLRGEPQRSSTPHPLTPCGGDASATLSDGAAGSEARMRPHRPQPAPEVFPMQSVATAPRGDRSQAALRVPTRGVLRPCRASSCSVCFATSPVRMVEHPTGPFASGFQRPSLRGVVRAQARTEARAWRVTRRRLETRRAMPCRARYRTWRPTLGETPSQRPRGRRSRSFTPFPRRLSPNGPTTGLPRG